MRLTYTLWLFFLLGALSAQEQKIEQLQRQFLEARAIEKPKALDEYIAALVRSDRLAADSVINEFFHTNRPEPEKLEWTRLYYRMADVKYFLRDYDNAFAYLDTALDRYHTSSPGSDADIARAYELKGIVFQRLREYDSAASYFDRSLPYAKSADSKEVLAKVYNTIGTNHWYLGDYASALKGYNQSLKIRLTLPDTARLAENYRNIGLTYRVTGDYATAIVYYKKALPIFMANGNQSALANMYNSLGVLYKELTDYDEAIAFHEKSLSIQKMLNDSVAWASSLDNVGSVEIEKGNFGKALEVLLQAEALKKGFTGNTRMENTLSNIGVCYDKLGQNTKAIDYFRRSLSEAEASKDERAMARVYNNLNLLYREEGKYNTALKYAQESLRLSKAINTPEALSVAHLYLSNTFKAMGRFEQALEQNELYLEHQAILFDQKTASERSKMMVSYDFASQQQALEQSEVALQNLNKERELLKSRQLLLWMTILALLITVVLLFFIFRSGMKKGKLEQQLTQSEMRLAQLSRENLDQQLRIKDAALSAYAGQLSQKNEIIANFEKQLASDKTQDLLSRANRVEGRAVIGSSWEEFRLKFDQVHTDFVPKLNDLHPDLTNNELDISILLRINLSNKDIASILGASYESVKKSVQRLYKKLGLNNADDLRSYLLKI